MIRYPVFNPQNIGPALVTATGATTPRALSDYFADITNVKNYGAVGDGVTDDSAAINAAIVYCASKGGGMVFFPHGVYGLANPIMMLAGVYLWGAGGPIQPDSTVPRVGSTLRAIANLTYMVSDASAGAINGNSYGMTNINIDGNNTTANGGAGGFTVTDGILLGMLNGRFDNIYVTNCSGNGVHNRNFFQSLTGNTHSNTTIDNLSTNPVTLGVLVGMTITGTNIPANTTVAARTATTITLSQAATGSSSGSTFYIGGGPAWLHSFINCFVGGNAGVGFIDEGSDSSIIGGIYSGNTTGNILTNTGNGALKIIGCQVEISTAGYGIKCVSPDVVNGIPTIANNIIGVRFDGNATQLQFVKGNAGTTITFDGCVSGCTFANGVTSDIDIGSHITNGIITGANFNLSNPATSNIKFANTANGGWQIIGASQTPGSTFITGRPSDLQLISGGNAQDNELGNLVIDTTNGLKFTNQSSGAAGFTGTLTNAPATGNPQFWLPVTIGGVNYWIPAWHT
jgi:Pectate lyase superfamily protein